MFERARRRLAFRYLAILVVVLVVFSAVFLAAMVVLLQPAFDIAPELPVEASRRAYQRALERIVLAVLAADLIVVVSVGAIAYYLADRTLRPIREAHERQRRFVADASHEMRSPVAAIRLTAESTLADPSIEKDQVALRTILGVSEHLSVLTGDLLLLAQSEQGLLEHRPERVDLSVLTAESVEAARRSHDPPGEVSLSLSEDLLVEADEAEVERIVNNLVDNAIRHGGPGGVRVATYANPEGAVVEVADHGPGIAPGDLDRVFEPFFRVRADAEAPEGTGLGLAIAADLARRNGGRLTVESQPGAGAKFRLTLPRAR